MENAADATWLLLLRACNGGGCPIRSVLRFDDNRNLILRVNRRQREIRRFCIFFPVQHSYRIEKKDRFFHSLTHTHTYLYTRLNVSIANVRTSITKERFFKDPSLDYVMTETSNSSNFNHAFGTDNEWSVDEMMVIFIAILLLTLLLQYVVSYRFQLSFLGDAGTAMLTGLICGGLVKAFKSDNSDNNIQDNVLSFSPTIFFTVLLPPIIFSSGYQMKASWFFNNVWKVRAVVRSSATRTAVRAHITIDRRPRHRFYVLRSSERSCRRW